MGNHAAGRGMHSCNQIGHSFQNQERGHAKRLYPVTISVNSVNNNRRELFDGHRKRHGFEPAMGVNPSLHDIEEGILK